MSQESVRFDRAVEYYDRTRSLLPETMEKVLGNVVPELRDVGRVLEIGAGTGRFTRPFKRAGIDVYGVDLSLPMLAKLVETSIGGVPPLVQGDATLLPFKDGSFGAGFGVHILHLIPDWRTALAELIRVIEPGGKCLLDIGMTDTGEWERMQKTFGDAAGITEVHLGIAKIGPVDEVMVGLGATPRSLDEVVEVRGRTYKQLLDGLESGLWSYTWRTDDAGRSAGAAAVRKMLEEEGKVETDPLETVQRINWRVYDLS